MADVAKRKLEEDQDESDLSSSKELVRLLKLRPFRQEN